MKTNSKLTFFAILFALLSTAAWGQSENRIEISTAEDLKALATAVNGGTTYNGYIIALTSDIELSGTWTPIGSGSTYSFQGIFDGQGYTISGLSVSGVTYAGLFGYVGENGQIKNVNVVATEIRTSTSGTITIYAGGLAGYYASSMPIENSSVMADSIVAASTTSGSSSYSSNSGGLIGYASSTLTIENSYATGNVSATPTSSAYYNYDYSNSGGLVGYASGMLTIENSYATGNVSATSYSTSYSNSGGLVGRAGSTLTIENSYATGNVSAAASSTSNNDIYSNSGGLVGRAGTLTIENSYATGNVSATATANSYSYSYSGGLVGYANGVLTIETSYATGDAYATANSYSYSGGLVGYANDMLTIENSYASGNISGTYSGGIFGRYSTGTITSVYYNSAGASRAAGSGSPNGITALNDQMLKYKAFFLNWDFNDIWAIEEGVSYPYLKNNAPAEIPGIGSPEPDDYSIVWYLNNPNASIFKISTEKELKGLVLLVNQQYEFFSERTIKLINNIELSEAWTPIGSGSSQSFQGIFDGLGYTISGLFVSGVSYAGLFGYVGENGQIKNINVVASEIRTITSGTFYAGGLVGYYASSMPIENSSVMADSIVANSTSYSGGLVGSVSSTLTIESSYATGNVSGAYSGGLVGSVSGTLTIENSYATGDVSATSSSGGLVGSVNGMLTIKNSYATGDVSSNSSSGGLVGNASTLTIENSYAAGNVSGAFYSGGLVGDAGTLTIETSYATGNVSAATSYNRDSNSGGLVGYAGTLTIETSYATGDVSATSSNSSNRAYSGGLVGYVSSSGKVTIKTSYAIGDVSATSSSGGLVGYVSTTLTIETSYATGDVSANSSGGLVGYAYSANISYSYATGNVSGTYYSGGLVGNASTLTIETSYATGDVSAASYSGGLVGSSGTSSTIETSYASGTITATESNNYAGGIFGYYSNGTGTITSVYYNSEGASRAAGVTSGGFNLSIGITDLNEQMLKYKVFFPDWDFDDVWAIEEGASYPYLKNNAPAELPGIGSPEPDDYSIAWYGSNPNTPIFEISTEKELKGLALLVNRQYEFFSERTIKLINDIELSEAWTPIGNNSYNASNNYSYSRFKGIFDGQGYTISGLSVDSVQYAGLFGYIGENGQIKNVNVVATEIRTSTSGTVYAGGLAGYYASSKPIENSSVKADSIVATYSGGLVGSAGTLTIKNSYATGNVSGTYSGGLVGDAYYSANISYSYASGNISGTSYSGGIIGIYSGGTITSSGGIISIYSGGTITSVYYNSAGASRDVGNGFTTGITALSSENMMKKASFVGWDFYEVWEIKEGETYPYLRTTYAIQPIADQIYTGSQIEPEISIYKKSDGTVLTKGTDYILTYGTNINAGIGTINIIGQGNYADYQENNVTFNIVPKSLDIATVTHTMVYDGTYYASNIIVTLNTADIVGNDEVYASSASGFYASNNVVENPLIRISSITLGGANSYNYEVSISQNYISVIGGGITRKTIEEEMFSISSIAFSGNELEPEITAYYYNDQIYIGYVTFYIDSYSDNINAGTGYVNVIGTGNYDGSLTLPFTILKADPIVSTVPTGLTATLGQKLADVSLAAHAGWLWTNTETLVGNVGSQTHNAIYNPDPANYNNSAVVELTVNVIYIEKYTITAITANAAGGSVTGSGSYEHGASVTLAAIASDGYKFVNWTEDGVEVSSNASYQFAATRNRILVANFEAPPSLINSQQIAIGQISVQAISGGILLENLPSNAKVELFNLQGKQVYSAMSAEAQCIVPLQTKGVYIVKVGAKTFKVVK